MNILEKYFDTAFAAPNGIKKLRELILTLAMQGKLVPQDPGDTPACDLLKEIEAEKAGLVKAGKIKPQKPLPPIKLDEVPYQLPKGWEWVRLNEYGIWKSGSTPSRTNSSFYGGNIPWVKSGEVKQGKIFDTEEAITQKALDSCSLDLNPIGAVLIAMYGANIGDVGVLEIEATTNQAICACKSYLGINNIFLSQLLLSLKQNFVEQGAGAAQPNISREKIIHTVVPLPPLAEQRRIVEKIDQLMARCDALEKLRAERDGKRLAVHAAALKRLLDSKSDESFADAWAFIKRHFGDLYSVKENVADLRKAILELAMKGKLVPQDPGDTPACDLLKEIEAEKAGLVKAGKIKAQQPLPPIKPEEVPYQLPKGWEWVRLGEITDYNGRKNINAEEIEPDTWVLDLEDIEKDTSRLIYRAKYSERQSKSTKSTFEKGDVLYGKLRPYLDKVIVADCNGVCTTEIVPIIPFGGINSEFLRWLLKRPFFLGYVNSLMYGVKMPRLGTEDATKSIHPLPPLAEQRRIVAKIDQLMALCDALEQHIEASTRKQTELLGAVMAV